MSTSTPSDKEAADALINVIGESRWEAVALAYGYLAALRGEGDEQAARLIRERGPQALTLTRSRELLRSAHEKGFLNTLPRRKRTGSAENPITKLFPATITEERFLESLDELHECRPGISFEDAREVRHSLVDFTLRESGLELPINIKNAGTRFEQAERLVGIAPDDCIPIPAYKAHAAIEVVPSLLYVVSVDYELVKKLEVLIPQFLTDEEMFVWRILNEREGSYLKNAEDTFIFSTVRKYWDKFRPQVSNNPFHVISARKSVRILQTKPQRTPGIGLRAWGTGASAEVNVHISIKEDTTPWEEVRDRICAKGIQDIISAVNRRRVEEVYDPEI